MNAVARSSKTAAQPQPDELELTILMPCLNEAETIGVCVWKAMRYLARTGVAGEVLVADNGSTDGSQAIAEGLGARVVAVADRGYGAALRGGIAAARGRYIIMGDADDSYDFTALDGFVEKLRGGADLVMGNRFAGGIEKGAMPFLHRYLGNPVLSFVGRLFFGTRTGDFHCGLRGFRADAIRALALQTTGMEFASEMVVRAALSGLAISEVPTTLRPDGRSRPPHLKTWRDGWRHLKFLLMYNPRWLFVIPGTALATAGAILVAALLLGPLQLTGELTLDFNSFVAACFMVLAGVQLVTFGALSRRYAAVTGMLPSTRGADWLVRNISTDRLALGGGALLACGLGLFGYALADWSSTGFGPLADPRIPRVVTLGLTLTAIGLQFFFSAFLLGILDIPARRGTSEDRPEELQQAPSDAAA
jgi:glycosyltransferase involved in cell wall biosynthesis